ncbi:MAG: type II secretion system protein GspD [Planctomycetota bacterium]|nr:MAG: type II secretion system protein GspD [Planctomycetota bacterium]
MCNTEKPNKRIRKRLLAWGIVLAVMVAIVVGDVSMSPAKAYAYEENDVADSNAIGDEVDISTSQTIQSITFKKNTRITDALRFLSAKYQKNIVPSSKVDGLITVTNLYEVTFEEALQSILGYGYRYDKEGNFIKVYTSDEYKKIKEDRDRMINKVFTLYYISAAEATKLLTPVLSKVGTLEASSPAETVVPTGESISAGSSGGDSMALNDRIVIRDYPENIAEAQKLLQELDVRPKQVLIEATILSATLTEETALGIDWNTLEGVAIDTIANVASGTAEGMSITGFFSGAETSISSGGFTAGVVNDRVSAIIRALESVSDITILANPKILAVNKQLGQVYIGNKIGYVSQTTQTETSTTQQVEFLETGTKLSFRPYIGDDDYIRMDIQPKDSAGTLKANNIPDESSTELSTNIMVKDGQTIVIGGLFRDVVRTTLNQVPLIGDLPFIGAAFRNTVDKMERQEVIVMLTPHIVKEAQETNSEARAVDINRKRMAAKQEHQWAGRARLAEDRYSNAARYYLEGDNEAALKELEVSLKLRPAYLEAIRLKDKIITETDPNSVPMFERNVLNTIEKEDLEKWRRR